MKSAACCLLALTFTSCTISTTVESLGENSPPPELGRPGWVRVCAGTGAWIGGIVGGLVSIVLLPIDYPIMLLADDGLGERTASDFLLWPAMGGAAFGHALLGCPPDVVDYVFRRAWVGEPDDVPRYDLVPMPGPALPKGDGVAEPAANGTK